MSHGLPNGYVTLYDGKGNPVEVRLHANGEHSLAVSDDGSQRLLEDILETLEGILEELKER